MDQVGSAINVLFLVHSSRSIQRRYNPVSEIVFTLFSVFSVDQVLASQIKTEEETSWVKSTPHWDSAIGHPSLIHKSGSIQHSKTVQIPKLFSHSSLCFLVDQVLASQIKTEEETSWMKPTLLVTHLLYTVQDLFSAARQSSFQNSFHCGSAVSHWSLKQSSKSF